MHAYLIGIDFGTTNCTLAYAASDSSLDELHQLPIDQYIAAGQLDKALSLPSFLYYPLDEERQKHNLTTPSGEGVSHIVGLYARQRGSELPDRVIASSKSWLCHSAIDRREAILPLESASIDSKISPLQAACEILTQLRHAWESAFPDAPFAQQHVLITIPASFDPSARQLVVEAASMAGYPEVILLEEPLAAFYAWLKAVGERWREYLKVGDRVLVVDIGGGTTDFSLICVEDDGGNLLLRRTAVGSHLLLGGDNIDLALAHFAKHKLEEQGHDIDDWQLQSLVHQCRSAKELLLGENPPPLVDIVIMGRGSRLIGGSLKTQLSASDVAELVINGFMPLIAPDQYSDSEKAYAIQQQGLPYAKDPRITAQLAKFLSQTGEADQRSLEGFVLPTAVLFNGGTTKAFAFRQRLLAQLNQWAELLKASTVVELPLVDYDFAVSRGAVAYGLARQGRAIRVRSGTSRSYFVGVEEALPAIPGIPKAMRAICVAPFGMEEGSEVDLMGQKFSLLVGQPATFRFFSHAVPQLPDGSEPVAGTVVKRWQRDLTELHPIEVALDQSNGDEHVVQVELKSRVTELGMLELWCVAADGRKWKLEFDVRNKNEGSPNVAEG